MLVSSRSGRLLSCLALSVAAVRCTPDFDSLSTHGAAGELSAGGVSAGGPGAGGPGAGATAGGVTASGGVAGRGGSTAGESLGGSEPKPTAGAGAVPAGGNAGGGTGATAGAPITDGGEGGAAGAAPTPCVWVPQGSTHYDGFDGGLDGTGFGPVLTTVAVYSTLGATATRSWDDAVGKTCPGSFLLETAFKGYVGAPKAEYAIADMRFEGADWTGATKLHAWLRVSPNDAPLTGVQLFVMSGSSYLYASVFEGNKFAFGQWFELVLPLSPGKDYDPKLVSRVGVQVTLRPEGAAGNPPVAPTVQAWLDDIWVE
jgi:hypothetical protein